MRIGRTDFRASSIMGWKTRACTCIFPTNLNITPVPWNVCRMYILLLEILNPFFMIWPVVNLSTFLFPCLVYFILLLATQHFLRLGCQFWRSRCNTCFWYLQSSQHVKGAFIYALFVFLNKELGITWVETHLLKFEPWNVGWLWTIGACCLLQEASLEP